YGRLRGFAGDVAQYLACSERAAELAEASDDAVLECEMRSVLAHAQLAVGRLASARTTAAHALAELARVAGLREAVGHSTAPALCRTWWALASVYLGHAAEAQAALEALLAEESDSGLQALYGTDRKSTRLNSSHVKISYAVFCLKKKKQTRTRAYVYVDQ